MCVWRFGLNGYTGASIFFKHAHAHTQKSIKIKAARKTKPPRLMMIHSVCIWHKQHNMLYVYKSSIRGRWIQMLGHSFYLYHLSQLFSDLFFNCLPYWLLSYRKQLCFFLRIEIQFPAFQIQWLRIMTPGRMYSYIVWNENKTCSHNAHSTVAYILFYIECSCGKIVCIN